MHKEVVLPKLFDYFSSPPLNLFLLANSFDILPSRLISCQPHNVVVPSSLYRLSCENSSGIIPGVTTLSADFGYLDTDLYSSLSSLSATQLGGIAIKGQAKHIEMSTLY
jgi:hypothetical protein